MNRSLYGFLLCGLGLVGCASGQREPGAAPGSFDGEPAADQPSAAPPEAEGLRISETEDDDPRLALDRAEAELERILGGERDYATPPTATPADPETTSVDSGGESGRPAKRADALGGGPCHAACRALASMRRSADRLCAISGDDEPRCGDARGRVERAEERVSAHCPACAEG